MLEIIIYAYGDYRRKRDKDVVVDFSFLILFHD